MLTDPVCGMELTPRGAAAMALHQGRAYYFCSGACHQAFQRAPATYAGRVPAAALTVGVMGSAGGDEPVGAARLARELGTAVAARGLTLITGACPGLPLAAAQGAKATGGLSIGISPALSFDEHIHQYHSPADGDSDHPRPRPRQSAASTSPRCPWAATPKGVKIGREHQYAVAVNEGGGTVTITDVAMPEIVAVID